MKKTPMSTAVPTLRDVLVPVCDAQQQARMLGTVRAGNFTAYLMAYMLYQGHLLALVAGAGSKTHREAVWAALAKGNLVDLDLEVPARRHLRVRRLDGRDTFERLDHDGALPASNGYPLLYLHRMALTDYLASPPERMGGRFERLLVFGPPGSPEPYALWLQLLRLLLLLPEQPGWAEIVWREAVADKQAKLVEPITESVGFAPAWVVRADAEAWRALYARLARRRQLKVAERPALAGAQAPELVWSLADIVPWRRP